MGTRATITFMDNQDEFVIYQHWGRLSQGR